MARREARVNWEGNLLQGKGEVSGKSGIFTNLPVSWASRVEEPDGRTSPEELIAAAHASCYAMALSNTLTEKGHPPTRLNIVATCTVDPIEGGIKITRIDLNVSGEVAGLDNQTFQAIAKEGEAGCPVSNALRGNVEIYLEASLV